MRTFRCFSLLGPLLLGLPLFAQEGLPIFLDQSTVEDVRLTLDPKDWAKLQANYLENTYYKANFHWRGQHWDNVGIRSRGRGTRSQTKPALRIDFSRYTSSQRFQGMKNLSLENLEQDAPMMREFLSMALFRQLGLPAPREVYIHLFINDQDLGLHLAMEFFDKTFLSRAVGEDAGDLYEYSWVDHWDWYPRGGGDANYVPEPFELKTNENSAKTQALRDLIDSLASSQTTDFDKNLASRLDMNHLLRHFAVEVFLAETDGLAGDVGTNNFYIYRRSADGRFQFLPWDKDATLADYERDIWKGVPQSELLRKLLDVPAHRQRFLEEIARLIQYVESDQAWLHRLAEETEQKIRPLAIADPVKRFSAAEFEDSIVLVKHFLRERPRILRQYLEREGFSSNQ